MRAELNTGISRAVIHKQNACGYLFVVVYLLNIVILVLTKLSATNASVAEFMHQISFLPYLLTGTVAVIAFIMLYTISSNTSSDIFAASMISLELFFSILLPALILDDQIDKDNTVLMMWVCAALCCVAILLWMMLLSNNHFSPVKSVFIGLLPLPYFINIIRYLHSIGLYSGYNIAMLSWSESTASFYISLAMIPFMVVGYWMLSHSSAYSNHKGGWSDFSISITHPVTITYGLGLTVVAIIFLCHAL